MIDWTSGCRQLALTATMVLAGIALAAAGPQVPKLSEAVSTDDVLADMVSHRAVFDMKLTDSASSSSVTGLSGRMVFETIGSACEGYTINFRFVTEVEDSQGTTRLTDMRTTTFEEAGGKRFQFLTQTFIDKKLVEESKGTAVHEDGKTRVSLVKPENKTFVMSGKTLFPTQHLIEMLRAARNGEPFLPADIYDGSEGGEKVFPTATAIGKRIEGPDDIGSDTAAGVDAMAALARWPVTVGYFDGTSGEGEATPTYEMSFLLYQNGISRRVKIDYGEFVIAGDLVDLEIHEASTCKVGERRSKAED